MENPKRSLLRRGRDPSSSSAGRPNPQIQRECVNSVKKFMRREIGDFPRMSRGASSNAPEKFRNIQLQEEFDTYDPNVHRFLKMQSLKDFSKIIEIVAAKDVIFALAQSGLCAAFSRTTNRHICFLNISPDEVIRSLFYNKNNDALITVSVYASNVYSILKCRTTPVEYIRRNQLDAGFPLFETESRPWPSFVMFDDVNGKVLTLSARDGIYKVFDLKNYSFLYSISDKNAPEIKISPGIMLLIYPRWDRNPDYLPLKILSIEDGTVLKSFNHLLHQNKKVDFIEQFNEKLLVKQENENLQIVDVRNSELTEVSRTEFITPSKFIFLYENHLFLTFRNRTVALWNLRGELVTSFEDHLLWYPDYNFNNIYITSDQDMIISYCKAEEGCDDDGEEQQHPLPSSLPSCKLIKATPAGSPLTSGNSSKEVKWLPYSSVKDRRGATERGGRAVGSERCEGSRGLVGWGIMTMSFMYWFENFDSEVGLETALATLSYVGSINMSNILTGKCISKICSSDPALQISPRVMGDDGRSSIKSTVRGALEEVTALFYDEDRNEIYTGNKQGQIHVWSS